MPSTDLPPPPTGPTDRLGIDSGGTFTDAVAIGANGDIRVAKVPSTPDDPGTGVAAGADAVRPTDRPLTRGEIRHGTTVPTNALLERRGARTALVTTAGFADVIEIGRQRRPDLYDHTIRRPEPLVPPELRFEVNERLSADGEVLVRLGLDDLPAHIAAAAPDAVAVCLLHAWRDPAHERGVAAVLRRHLGPDVAVVCSHEVAPEFREYERTSTTVLHAYLTPGTARYLDLLQTRPGFADLLVMRSAGGLGRATDLARRPADALLSGPAAGALAAADVAAAAGFATALGFDMGGTSTDVCLLLDGRPHMRAATEVGGLACLAPALAIHTVGAGGGSIATLDNGGALRVGPRSAGARPGPACYGRGGTEPTVTDANAALGRVTHLAGGSLAVDADAARRALAPLGDGAADAVIDVVEATMEAALRHVSVQQGIDPGGLAIVAFGGAGALHAAALAAALGAGTVLVPPAAGVLSAVGLCAAPVRADRSRTDPLDLDDDADAAAPFADRFQPLATAAADEVAWAGEPHVRLSLDCRYRGQSHETTITYLPGDSAATIRGRFEAAHDARNGYVRPGAPVQIVTWRAAAEVRSAAHVGDILRGVAASRPPRLPDGMVEGPCTIVEDDATTWVPAGWRAHVDDTANLRLEAIR